jgi:hypothetical protein
VDGVNREISDDRTFTGPQAIPIVRIPAVTLPYNAKPRITVTQTAGTTLKAFPFTIIIQVMEVI